MVKQVAKNVQKSEFLDVARGNVKWGSRCGEQFANSSKS